MLEPRAREAMAALTVAAGRPMVHDLRAMCDAIAYVAKNGVEWRALPADFPPREAVCAFFERWNGRGRHVAVDTEGWLLPPLVTAASVSDKAGAKILLIKLFDAFSTLKIMWADTGYNGTPLARYAQAVAAITVEVVARASPHSFQVLRRRWVVERTR